MRIGIVLTGDYTWAGGLYYSLNLVKLLSDISKRKKLTVVVIVNESTPINLLNEIPEVNTEVCYLNKKSFFYRVWHKLKNDRFSADVNALNLDVLYPLISYEPRHADLNCRVFYWIYDFQHKFLPHLFSAEEIKKRDSVFEQIAANAKDAVFSSYDSKTHFEQFYSQSECRRHVYNFVSLLNIPVAATYKEQPYFIVCNQFWPHKNHRVVLGAMTILARQGTKPYFIFTGKHDDERNREYVNKLLSFMEQNNLGSCIKLTGFISRDEQIALMKGATAVMQPSFFEGWSTVVEDAKALGKYLVLSDLPVHREQVKSRAAFFNPENEMELALELSKLISTPPEDVVSEYEKNIQQSSEDLIKLFNIA